MKRGVFIKSGSELTCGRAGIQYSAGIISALKKAGKDICRREIIKDVFYKPHVNRLSHSGNSLGLTAGSANYLQYKIKRNECL